VALAFKELVQASWSSVVTALAFMAFFLAGLTSKGHKKTAGVADGF
jgi:hypothetical protein